MKPSDVRMTFDDAEQCYLFVITLPDGTTVTDTISRTEAVDLQSRGKFFEAVAVIRHNLAEDANDVAYIASHRRI